MANSQASLYHPFPTTNTSWEYRYYNDFHQPTGIGGYWINGDTTISNLNYMRIYGCGASGWCNSGSIRDSGKVIYFIPDTGSIEYVLYDFNLNLGDTLFNSFNDSSGYPAVYVIDVDSVLCSDGFHRRLWFNTFDRWIEGIGSTTYLFAPTSYMGLSGNDELQCKSTDSGFHYPNSISGCIVSSNEPTRYKSTIKISPNPFHGSSTILIPSGYEKAELRIYNTLGQLKCHQWTEANETRFQLDQGELKEGIYLLQIISREKHSSVKFIID